MKQLLIEQIIEYATKNERYEFTYIKLEKMEEFQLIETWDLLRGEADSK